MRWEEIGSQTCSIARALAVVGDRWTLLVLREAFGNARRFDRIQRRVGATRPVVAQRLARLVEAGVLERVAYQERPRRYEYRLTDMGHDLYPVLLSLMRWGDRWLDGGAGRPLELVHDDCRGTTTPVLVCSECGEPLEHGDLRVRPGPPLRRLEQADQESNTLGVRT